jgi:hypothetical protein
MASKDVCGSDHKGIISLLESVLSSESDKTDRVQSVRRNPTKMYSVLKIKQKK